MLWNHNGIKVFLDVSTYCNAGCPQCHRTSENGLGKQDWLPLVRWDLETFQKAFPPEEMKHIETFKFCGTWGDPVMCKELNKMCEYIIAYSFTNISIDTNGSIRDTDWWWDLGVKCGSRLEVIFAVDGINQEMHQRYRRFTDLDKVLDNMNMLSQTRAKIKSQTILFKHNQEYKDEIKELVKENGSTNHSFVISDRFDRAEHKETGIRPFINEHGNEDYLERADQGSLPKGKISGTNDAENAYEIKCRWAIPRNEVVVNPDGQVLPCCFHANAHYKNKFDPNYGKEVRNHPIYMDEYDANPKDYNVLYTPLRQIIKSEWYQKTLPNSMKSDNVVPQCARQCSNRIKKQHQIRENHIT